MILLTAIQTSAAATLRGAVTQPTQNAEPSRPHVIVAMIDDLGWNDVHGGDDGVIKTPNLDRLALDEGIQLDRHYAYNWCGPSRASIMTGRVPTHVYYKHVDSFAINPETPGTANGPPTGMSMLSDKFKEASYKTVYHGKWGLGFATHEHMPLQRGYDEFYGYLSDANDYWTKDRNAKSIEVPDTCSKQGIDLVDIWEQDRPSFKSNNSVWEDFLFEEATVNTIKNYNTTSDEPLFLFHAFHSVHTPLDPPLNMQEAYYPDMQDKTRRGYATMVSYVDGAVGRFVDALKEKKMWDNTLLLVVSDNGGPIYFGDSPKLFAGANNAPLRGGKTSDWEGGIRVRSFLSGGFLPEARRGVKLEGYGHFADWLATFSTLAGYSPTDEKAAALGLPAPDSIDLLPYLMGDVEDSPRKSIVVSDKTVIRGDYKVVFGNGGSIDAAFEGIMQFVMPDPELMKFDTVGLSGYGKEAIEATLHRGRNCSHGCLFNIFADPTETTDLCQQMPAKHAEMTAFYEEAGKTVFAPYRGAVLPGTCQQLHRHGGFYAPFYPDVGYLKGTPEMPFYPGTYPGY